MPRKINIPAGFLLLEFLMTGLPKNIHVKLKFYKLLLKITGNRQIYGLLVFKEILMYISIRHLIMLCKLYRVSADYILGISESYK